MLKAFDGKRYLDISNLDRFQSLAPVSLLSWLLPQLHVRQMKQGRYLVNSLISSIGRVSQADFGLTGFQADVICFLPMPIPIPIASTNFVVTEYGRSTEICISVPQEFEHRLDEIVQKFFAATGLSESGRPCVFGLPLRPLDKPDINERIEGMANRFPDRIALEEGSRYLSYSEMMTTRDLLASALLRRGGSGAMRVALLMNRSIETVLTMLASLKAVDGRWR